MLPKEKILVEKIKKGGLPREEAIKAIYTDADFQRPVWSYVYKNGGDHETADMVFSEGVAELDRYIRRHQGDTPVFKTSLGAYLYGICCNIRKKQLAKIKAKPQDHHTIELDLIPHASGDMRTEFDNKFEVEALAAIMEKMGDNCRQTLKLYYIEGYRLKEIAEMLNLKNANVAKTMRCKCMKKLLGLIDASKEFKTIFKRFGNTKPN